MDSNGIIIFVVNKCDDFEIESVNWLDRTFCFFYVDVFLDGTLSVFFLEILRKIISHSFKKRAVFLNECLFFESFLKKLSTKNRIYLRMYMYLRRTVLAFDNSVVRKRIFSLNPFSLLIIFFITGNSYD